MNGFEMTLLAYARANQARFLLYLNKPSIALEIELGRCNVTLTDILDLIYLRFA